MDYINAIENCLQKEAIINYLPKQKGDVENTLADISKIKKDFNFNPKTNLEDGILKFVQWYKNFYKA